MLHCIKCTAKIEENEQHYIAEDMGPEITTILENLGQLMDENEGICSQCFENILQELSVGTNHENKLQHPNADSTSILCIWCERRLGRGRCHSLSEGPERYFISERISPRQIPEGAVVCHLCWTKVQQTLRKNGISYVPSPNTVVCVWCLRSLGNRRRHLIPDGPERNEIIARIHPREIPPGGYVCHACWVAACRNVQKNSKEGQQNPGPQYQHRGVDCVWCRMSLFQRQVRILRDGPEKDIVAQRIYPDKLPEHAFLCVNCWARVQEYVLVHMAEGNGVQLGTPPNPSISLADDYKHTSHSSSRCFVPNCTNPERLIVPDYLRKRILQSTKIYVTKSSRVCAEHRTIYNWEFLKENEFSSNFTQAEITSMLNLILS